MARWDSVSDLELLRSSRRDAQAFGAFYARHERRLLSYLVRRTRGGELAADLCAEVFAVALEACRAGRPIPEVPVAWLFGIANHKLIDGLRRERVDDRARRALEMRAIELTRGQISHIEQLCGEAEASALLCDLSADQREALLAYIVDEREYREIAAELRCSESVVRKRVSRGLAALRVRLEEAR
ncbi:MAG: RNA polymerase sigma factor [Solirubrobacteraceae bacterium]|jgi:RNA polymerase sigma-70 factor (ECF subfamily)